MERKIKKGNRNIFIFVCSSILCFESIFAEELTFSGLPFRLNRDVSEGVSLSSSSSKYYEDAKSEEEEEKSYYMSSVSDSYKQEVIEEEILATEESDDAFFVQGLVSYQNKQWQDSTIFLRRALTEPQYDTEETLYLIIMSEMYAGDFESALIDSDTFLSEYDDSPLQKNVEYQKGRAYHFTGQNDNAVLSLSNFCHQNPQSAIYPFALYWIAECFYDDYNFDTARELYEQIVNEYPDCKKAINARFKLDAIAQREREQKLLALLKEKNDDYLSSREDFERQLKEYETADIVMLRKQLNEANERIAELEAMDNDDAKKLDEYKKMLDEQVALNEELQKKQQEPKEVQEQEVLEPLEDLDDIDIFSDDIDPQTLAMIAKKRGISEEEFLKLKIRAAQLQRLLDELYCNSSVEEGEW